MERVATEKSALEAALNQQEKKLEKLSLEVCCVHTVHIYAHAHAHRAGSCARRLRTWMHGMQHTQWHTAQP